MANRLANESSPYLRQHAQNPVDWFPWGKEALEKAAQENKPILLSVGYSACHWCHVMEHESFSNPEIAALMNEHFINIKVDREERPDIDQIYQNVSQLMTRSGGWPLTVFLKPDLKPFFGGTYFPPDDRYGRPGFGKVLQALSNAYRNDLKNVEENATRLTDAIVQIENGKTIDQKTRPGIQELRKIFDQTVGAIDWRNGGFGEAPKFPHSMNLAYLWRFGVNAEIGMATEAVAVSLTKMARGGIYDQLGGGFHRYSVDDHWAVPHFEKMLYDNALLLKLYSEVLLTNAQNTSGKKVLSLEDERLYVRIVCETVQYVLREMRAPEGGFYCTQDADSEGYEGKFFIWNPGTLAEVLDEQECAIFMMRYGVTTDGNFEDPHHPRTSKDKFGETVLFLDKSISEIAASFRKEESEIESLLLHAQKKLFAARSKREAPHRDEKIITSWNALMISGLCWASRALQFYEQGEISGQALEAATVAMNFLRTQMTNGGDKLHSVYKDGVARLDGYLDDYAFSAMAALDLASTIHDEGEVESLISQSRNWIEILINRFQDKSGGGFFFTSEDHERLIARPKSVYDQAIPSGNAVAIECLLALGALTGESRYENLGDEILSQLFPLAEQAPLGMGELSCAGLLYFMGVVTIAGQRGAEACVHPHFFQKHLASETLLVCHQKTCDLPYTNPDLARKAALGKLSGRLFSSVQA